LAAGSADRGIGSSKKSIATTAIFYPYTYNDIWDDFAVKAFLAKNEKKRGPTGNEQKSNLTDPESAKMATSHGVIQGYNGLAVVDGQAQIVVHAEAHGSGYEAHLLAPLIEATRDGFAEMEPGKDVFADVKVTADSGFHSKTALAEVSAQWKLFTIVHNIEKVAGVATCL
jgi:hypothetical protein